MMLTKVPHKNTEWINKSNTDILWTQINGYIETYTTADHQEALQFDCFTNYIIQTIKSRNLRLFLRP